MTWSAPLIKESPIQLNPEHVKGHKVDKIPRHFLSRTEQLNDEMDNLAKAFWVYKVGNQFSPSPPPSLRSQ